ncbi:hypothetical protein cyc_02118 [Cyclospora cayetanensis]|uniref:Uncharacterized protein n=1 Tax=Cyclospora cayetanensis TaxID=88456 RepID=A0A1D3CWR1_9EIME|nr:hypothetical protein cyc_02118 [Cyclospora cayetanensis]
MNYVDSDVDVIMTLDLRQFNNKVYSRIGPKPDRTQKALQKAAFGRDARLLLLTSWDSAYSSAAWSSRHPSDSETLSVLRISPWNENTRSFALPKLALQSKVGLKLLLPNPFVILRILQSRRQVLGGQQHKKWAMFLETVEY